MAKYKEYKESGYESIGAMPADWQCVALKHVSVIQNGSTPSSSEKTFWDGDINWVTTDDLGKLKDKHIISTRRTITKAGYESCGTRIAGKGAVVISTRAPIGHLGILNIEACTNQGCKTIVPTAINSVFCYYFLKHARPFLESLGEGSTFKELPTGTLKSFHIPVPTQDEQTQIANYLDHKTSQIEKLITDKEKLIELLNEERTAIINQAVTKGLNPDAPMKDSGIEWLGEVPEHWEVKKLKYLLKPKRDALKTGPFGSHLKNSDLIEDGDIKVYTQRNVLDNNFDKGEDFISIDKYKSLKSFTVEPEDILLTTRGSIGRCSIFPAGQTSGILHPCLIRVQVDNTKASTEWVSNYINNTSLFFNNIKFNSNSTIIDVIYGYTLKEIFFPIPSIQEQSEILKFINDELQRIGDLNIKIRQEIQLLKEYKTALISEVVTGKVDVRDELIPETPELVP